MRCTQPLNCQYCEHKSFIKGVLTDACIVFLLITRCCIFHAVSGCLCPARLPLVCDNWDALNVNGSLVTFCSTILDSVHSAVCRVVGICIWQNSTDPHARLASTHRLQPVCYFCRPRWPGALNSVIHSIALIMNTALAVTGKLWVIVFVVTEKRNKNFSYRRERRRTMRT